MENAIKALLIAAAVLMAILIISMGMFIYSKSNNIDETSGAISEMGVTVRNEQYLLYDGVQTGGVVGKLLSMAADNNRPIYDSLETIKQCICIRSDIPELLQKFQGDSEMVIALNGTRDYGVREPDNILKISKELSKSKKYKVWFTYNEYGYIWEIHIDNI